MLGRFFVRLRYDRNVEAAADHLGDFLERHALFGNCMKVPSHRAALEHESIDAGGVETMHGRPAIPPVANIGRHALLARNPDQEEVELTGCDIQPARLVLKLKSKREPDLAEWAASRVSDVFAEVYGRSVVVTHERL